LSCLETWEHRNMEFASGQSGLCPPRAPLQYAVGPVPPRLRVLTPGDGVQLRCGTPPLQAAHRISSPIQLGRSVQTVQLCRTPSPVRRLDLRAETLGRSPSPARLLCHMSSPPVAANVSLSPCRQTPPPAMRTLASPQQLAMWHAPPQRPVRIAPLAMTAQNSQRTYVAHGHCGNGPNHSIARRPAEALSPESDLDISDREVSSNATTAVSPQTPLDALDRRVCEPQGPPPQRPVRSSNSQTVESKRFGSQYLQSAMELEELQRRMTDKDQEIHTLRSLAASAAEELETVQLRLTCVVCADADVQCIFQPCHHVVCCQECATQCQICPVCRCSVQLTAAVYLP